MRPLTLTLLSALGLACTFDASGIGEAASSGGAAASTDAPQATGASSTGQPTTSGPTTDPTGEPGSITEAVDPTTSSTGPGRTTGPTDPSEATTVEPGSSTTGPDESSSSSESTAPDTTTTGVDPCEGLVIKEIATVEFASVMAPMEKADSMYDNAKYARSFVAEKGTVSFMVDIECPGTYALWGRVLDLKPGTGGNDPDSFYVQVDGGSESGWFYGCQSGGLAADKYHWLRVRSPTMNTDCNTLVDVTPALAAGTHTITLRNREAGSANSLAGVTRILLTNDLAYVPMLPD